MKLTNREYAFVAVGVALGAILLAEEFLIRPQWERRARMQLQLRRHRRELRTVRGLVERFRENGRALKEMEARLIRPGDGFSLFSFLETAAGRAGIRSRLVSMRPSEASAGERYKRLSMAVRFEEVAVAQLVRYLTELADAPKLIRVGRLRLDRSARAPGRVRVRADIIAFSLVKANAEP